MTFESAGYIVCDNEVIHGIGQTADEAWNDFMRVMDSAAITIVADGEDAPDNGPSWARESDFKIRSATAELLALVEERGGNVAWRVKHGIACTVDQDC